MTVLTPAHTSADGEPAAPAGAPANLAWFLLAAACEAVALKDEELRYVWVNPAFCKLFDVDGAHVIGKLDDEVFLDGPRIPDPESELKVLDTGNAVENYETIFQSDGTLRDVLTSLSSATLENRTWLLLTFHDVTEVIAANHSLVQTTEALTAASAELRAQAMLDPLTGVLNRRGFEELASKAFAAHQNSGGFLMLDLDNFKQTNDCHGHELGDAVLSAFSATIRSITRADTDIVARLGGDEFVVAMPGSSPSEIEMVAERIRAGTEELSLEGARTDISVSVTIGGVHREPGPPIDLDKWRHAADELLYKAKDTGRNRVALDSMPEPSDSSGSDLTAE